MNSDALPVAAPIISDSAIRRAVKRLTAGSLHLSHWMLVVFTMSIVVATFSLLVQVLNPYHVGVLAWAVLAAGGLLLAAGPRLSALEAALFRRTPSPCDTLLVAANGTALVVCALAVLLPMYI